MSREVREAAERFLHECHGMLHLRIFSESRRAAHDALREALDRAPSGDGTPGPARGAALSGQDLIDAKAWLAFMEALAPDDIISGKAGLLRRLLDAVLMPGDSGGPREARQISNLIWHETGLSQSDAMELAGKILALRAELARAPNGWEEAAKVCEEIYETCYRIEGVKQCILALRARADAERPND